MKPVAIFGILAALVAVYLVLAAAFKFMPFSKENSTSTSTPDFMDAIYNLGAAFGDCSSKLSQLGEKPNANCNITLTEDGPGGRGASWSEGDSGYASCKCIVSAATPGAYQILYEKCKFGLSNSCGDGQYYDPASKGWFLLFPSRNQEDR